MREASPVRAKTFAEDGVVNVVIETPAGSRTKYAWDADAHGFRASKLLPLGVTFPFDFGFVPHTEAGDGDPLDVLVLADEPLALGCLVECRVLGALRIKTAERAGSTELERNDRVIAVPVDSHRGAEWQQLSDIGRELVDEIEAFLRSYVEREGRRVEIDGRIDRDAALELVRKAQG